MLFKVMFLKLLKNSINHHQRSTPYYQKMLLIASTTCDASEPLSSEERERVFQHWYHIPEKTLRRSIRSCLFFVWAIEWKCVWSFSQRCHEVLHPTRWGRVISEIVDWSQERRSWSCFSKFRYFYDTIPAWPSATVSNHGRMIGATRKCDTGWA